jgi:hypothetical protein
MKHGEKLLICTLAGLALSLVFPPPASGNPYQAIVERNVFGLKPPPPPPGPDDNRPPPPKIFLQGIYTFGGVKRVLFKLQMPIKPGQPPTGEQGFNLAEGQREGDIEVLEIDPKARTVKVNEFGTITNLDFESNGIKTASASAPGVAPPYAGTFVPPPTASPFNPAGGAQLSRPLRLQGPPGSAAYPSARGLTPAYASGASGYAGRTPSVSVGGMSLPLSGSTAQTQPGLAAQPAQPQMSAEEKFLMIEAYRARVKQLGLKVPPVPPTPLTRELNPSPQPDNNIPTQ